MAWTALGIDATHEAVDWICTLLASLNFPGEIQIAIADRPDWAFQVNLYCPERFRLQSVLEKLSPLERSHLISEPQIEDIDLIPTHTPLSYPVSDRFVILSSDAPEPNPPSIPLRIAPTLTFGSGFHPATQLCLKLLERHVIPGMKTLDLGCGSGILSVAIAKLNAQVLALDNDDRSVEATQAAAIWNQVNITAQVGSLGQGSSLGHWMGGEVTVPSIDVQSFDLIVANILARIHITLAKDYQRSLRPNGVLITAGYTTDYESEIDAAFIDAGFERCDRETFNEWSAIAYQLKKT
jgi:ribosomal protein L11 methyltransferase